MSRKKPTLSERYAAVILMLKWGDGRPVVDRDVAKTMSAREIIREFERQVQFDHGIHVAIDGSNHPTNLTPLPTAVHREKTNKIDIPQIAKTKRIEKAQKEFRTKLLAKSGLAESVCVSQTGRSRIRSRPLPGSKASGMRKRMSGKVEKRT